MSKIIIGIHGLGNKPPKPILTDWWKRSISEGLKKSNHASGNFEFELVYWADIFHPTPLDPDKGINSNPFNLKNSAFPENVLSSYELSRLRIKAREYIEKFYGKIVVSEVLSLKYPSLTDLFIHLNMRELENYYSPFYINNKGTLQPAREVIIERFAETLNKYKRKDILLICHSMGSIIAHDALIEKLPDLRIDTLITIGSPLGQKYVLNKAIKEKQDNHRNKLVVPKNILRNWYNLSDLEDHVALNHLLAEIYTKNSRGVKITDQLVQNSYTENGIRNTHSSFGYLRTPEFAEIVNSFLSHRKFNIFNWFGNFI